MATKKAGGSTRLGRDSQSKRLGVKLFGGQKAWPGAIIVRQRGTKFLPGKNVTLGKDFTIMSLIDGTVSFKTKVQKLYNGRRRKQAVNVEPL